MAPNKRQQTPSTPSTPSRNPTTTSSANTPSTPSFSSSSNKLSSTSSSASTSSTSPSQSPQAILEKIWNNYMDKTPQRTKLIDAFLAFLVVVGVLQFLYCIVAGNYPFNAFLAGFSATIGQFVLTASLRMQSNPENKAEFGGMSQER
ncbi:hypothetical protein MMC09_000007 [Bachmanniomyces sp. S44760]|nr:hypothetical protein [Bachmanniomyces sp. S44760]